MAERIDIHPSERPEVIASPVEGILDRINREEGREIRGVSAGVLECFTEYGWIGTGDEVTPDLLGKLQHDGWTGSGVELENALFLAAESCSGIIIEVADLPKYLRAREDLDA